jgi:hypothetical protein
MRAEIRVPASEVYGNALFALCCYESTFRPTNGKTESIYMQRDWVTVDIFIRKDVLKRTDMLKLKLKKMQIFLSCEMVDSACGSGKPH